MTVAVYIRISTASQNEASQRRDIERWLKGHNVGDVRYYVDQESGDTLARPEFERLQADLFHGEIDTVVVWALDRLSRTLADGIGLLCDWLDRGVRLVSVTQNLDFGGKAGQLIAAVLFAVAELEQETRRERQRSGIEAAKARGVYRGRKPGSLKASPQRAQELFSRGLTQREISTALGVSVRTVARYLASTRPHLTSTGS